MTHRWKLVKKWADGILVVGERYTVANGSKCLISDGVYQGCVKGRHRFKGCIDGCVSEYAVHLTAAKYPVIHVMETGTRFEFNDED